MDPLSDQNPEMTEEASVPVAESTPPPAPTTPPVSLTLADLEQWKAQVLEEARRTAQSRTDKALQKERERIQGLTRQAEAPLDDAMLKDYFGEDVETLRERRRAAALAQAYAQPPEPEAQPAQTDADARTQREQWAAQQLQQAGLDPSDPEWRLLHPDGYNSLAEWTAAKNAAAGLKAARQPKPTPPLPVAPVPPPPAYAAPGETPPSSAPPVIVGPTGAGRPAVPPTIEALEAAMETARRAGDQKMVNQYRQEIIRRASGV